VDLRGYLDRLLAHLAIDPASQMLVFSRTSVQAARVSPATPRAVYFSDRTAVAYVPGAPSVEIIGTDPMQGPIFYTLEIAGGGLPSITRRHTCLSCHLGPNTAGVPGLYVGSVIPGPTGAPLRDESAIITDHRSPFEDRWGGWYVTARRGEQRDRANAVASDPAEPASLRRESRQNLTSLMGLVDVAPYPAATSDIVALMVFEHQTQMANLITRVSWEARMALAANPDDDLARGVVAQDSEALVAYMLFEGEAPLVEPVEGVSSFARSFATRGPRDRRGRSLRDLDLRTRLFRYPLSYMIYSEAFDALPARARDAIYSRLLDVLSGREPGGRWSHLDDSDRRAILEIVAATKRDLPASWHARQ